MQMYQQGSLAMIDVDHLQDDYILTSDLEYRRSAGQFFTPRWIARGMASWVISTKPRRVVDPAFGFGILLDECVRQGYIGKLVGYELDLDLVRKWQCAFGNTSTVELIAGNFLESKKELVEAAIVNPPYNRFQNRELPAQASLQLAQMLGETASGYTNQYALFLYLVISRLSQDGRAAFIVPSEFLATGYGTQVKKFLMKSGRLRHLIIFDSNHRIFPDAATTACVLLFDKGLCSDLNIWHLSGQTDNKRFENICNDVSMDAADTCISLLNLDPTMNWQGLGLSQTNLNGFIPLGTFGSIKRGIATGANEFFVLSPSKIKELQFCSKDLVPCIASANSVSDLLFTADHWSLLKSTNKPCFLFDGLTSPSVSGEAYIKVGQVQGIHERYLTRMRKPWFRLESRASSPLLLAVFGRHGFRVILNQSTAVNLTAFHGFYPKPEYVHFVNFIWLYFQTPTALATYSGYHRSYGDGLNKLEPGDWSKLYVPDWRRWDSESLEQSISLASQAIEFISSDSYDQMNYVIMEMEKLVEKCRLSSDGDHQVAYPGQQMLLI